MPGVFQDLHKLEWLYVSFSILAHILWRRSTSTVYDVAWWHTANVVEYTTIQTLYWSII